MKRRSKLCSLTIVASLGQACGSAPDPTPVVDQDHEPVPAVDAATMAALAVDAAPDDLRPDAGTPADGRQGDAALVVGVDCKAARYCEDFEAYAAGPAPGKPWSASTSGGGKIGVDATRAFSGKQALHVTTPGGSFHGGMLTQRTPALPVTGNVLHGRMMVFFATRPGPAVHFTLFGAYGSLRGGGTAGYTMGGTGSGYPLFNYTTGDFSRGERTMKWPLGRWACAQWQFDGSIGPDGTTRDELRFWLDGSPRPDMTVVKTTSAGAWRAPTFDRLGLGFENYQATDAPIEVWIDDFAIDTRPIGCPAPP